VEPIEGLSHRSEVRTAFTASLGAFAPINVTADNRGEAVAFCTAGGLPGTAHVTATLPIVLATGSAIDTPLVTR
jgi:hypothetical protein